MKRTRFAAPAMLALATACWFALLGVPRTAAAADNPISAAQLAAAVRFLSADALEGRGPGSPGDRLARLYLATELEASGLEPAGGTAAAPSWEQPFPMIGIASQAPPTWEFSGRAGKVALARHDEFIAVSGVQRPTAALADAEVVFVGFGIQAPEFGWDDFKGADLRGKVLLMLNNDPDWDETLFAGKRRLYYGRWTYKYESAARQGAAGAILVHTTPSAGYPFQVVQSSWSGEQFELPAGDEPRLQIAGWTTEGAAERLVALSGRKLADLVAAAKSKTFRPVPLDVRTSLAVPTTIRRVETANVAGLLRGRDPELAAEEQGLLGSEHFATHPTIAAGRIAANINLDSANIYGRTRDVTFVGLGKSSLDAVVVAAAAAQGRTVHGDPAPEKGSFYRSDQFNFARIGVPAAYLDPGTDFVGAAGDAAAARARQEAYDATCYHQPCDELSADWIWDGMIEDTELALAVGLAVANADAMPTWNPGDEFEAARQRALAALAAAAAESAGRR